MRRLVAVLLVSLLALSVSAAGQSGENQWMEEDELEGTGIGWVLFYNPWIPKEEIEFDSRSDFSVAVLVDEDSNITSIEWITQVCINTGVCFPPETNEMIFYEDSNNSNPGFEEYDSLVDVDDDASYINWRFVLHHENGSESIVPEQGFGWKVWSNCWWDNGTWGGSSTHCQEEDDGGFLPGFAAPAAAAGLAMAALMARRD